MNKLVYIFSFFTLVCSTYAAPIAKVDIQKVLISVKEGKTFRDTLKKEFEEKQAIISKEEESIKKLQEDYQKQSAVIDSKTKAKKEREIQTKIMALQQKSMEFQKEIEQKQDKFKKPILEKIKKIIDTFVENKKYSMVFESTIAPISAQGMIDITNDVTKEYDKTHK